MMTYDEYNAFCGSLPATTHVVQWGGADVWKVGGKVFAIGGWSDGDKPFVTFKCSGVAFEMLQQEPGLRPAPYLAARGGKWIQMHDEPGLSNADLELYIAESHRLVAGKLTKKLQAELGLAERSAKGQQSAGLSAALDNWDGKSTEDLGKAFDRYSKQSDFIQDLIKLVAREQTQSGASWLLKRFLEQGGSLSEREAKQIYAHLGQLTHWEAVLHILQCIPFLPVDQSQREVVAHFLRECLIHRRPFVRAWAYNGFNELAIQHPEFTGELEQLLDGASQDKAASVQARVRNIRKLKPAQ